MTRVKFNPLVFVFLAFICVLVASCVQSKDPSLKGVQPLVGKQAGEEALIMTEDGK